jgi:type I restriction enzyme S subunit
MNATLEAIARAIFTSWFVDFDPVHAKARGEAPAGMDAATAALVPDAFVDSELGPIPAGWEVTSALEEFDVNLGQSPPGSTYNEEGEGLPFYQGSKDFAFRYPEYRVYCTEPKRLAQPNDTLISVRAPVGDVNMAFEKCCIGRGLWAVRHKSGSRSYTYYAMKKMKEYFDRFNAEGTVFGSLSKRKFKRIPVLSPPTAVVKRFEEIVYPMDEMIENNMYESRTLADLRDTLLPKLISGGLRVPEKMRQD